MCGQVGIDLVPLQRAHRLLRQPDLLDRVLTTTEQELSTKAHGLDAASVAGRIAAKEALFKALLTDGQTIPWLSTQVLRGTGGWPDIALTGRAAAIAERAGIGHISVSITHDGAYAMAVALASPAATTKARHVHQQGGEPMSTPTGTLDEVRDWILAKHPDRETIDADLDLIENRLVDSLSFVEFVFVIESASGASIDVEAIDVDDFRTLAALERKYFSGGRQ